MLRQQHITYKWAILSMRFFFNLDELWSILTLPGMHLIVKSLDLDESNMKLKFWPLYLQLCDFDRLLNFSVCLFFFTYKGEIMIHSKFCWGGSNGSINLNSLEQDLASITLVLSIDSYSYVSQFLEYTVKDRHDLGHVELQISRKIDVKKYKTCNCKTERK